MDTRRSIGREKAGYREGPCDTCRSHSLSRSSRCTARPNLIRRSGCNFGEQTACQAEGSSMRVRAASSLHPSLTPLWTGQPLAYPAVQKTGAGAKYTYIEYARFADDLVILIDAYKRHDWLVGAVDKRLREEFGKLQVEINDEKSRIVDLERGESFGFLGFDFRYLRSLRGVWRPHYTPKLKKRTALMRELKEVFRRYRSQPI